jgi:hypothetical protein
MSLSEAGELLDDQLGEVMDFLLEGTGKLKVLEKSISSYQRHVTIQERKLAKYKKQAACHEAELAEYKAQATAHQNETRRAEAKPRGSQTNPASAKELDGRKKYFLILIDGDSYIVSQFRRPILLELN